MKIIGGKMVLYAGLCAGVLAIVVFFYGWQNAAHNADRIIATWIGVGTLIFAVPLVFLGAWAQTKRSWVPGTISIVCAVLGILWSALLPTLCFATALVGAILTLTKYKDEPKYAEESIEASES